MTMKKIILGVVLFVLIVALGVGGWFAYINYGPQTPIIEVMPQDALVYGEIKEPLLYWNKLEQSELYKSIHAINVADVLKQNRVDAKNIDKIMRGYQDAMTFLKNPLVAKLLGQEVAFAIYTSKEMKAGMVLVTRPSASIQVAANMLSFLKDSGQDFEVHKEVIEGFSVTKIALKKENSSFKFIQAKNLLIFVDASSPLIPDVIATLKRQKPSLQNTPRFKDMSVHLYPQAQALLYIDIPGVLAQVDNALVKSTSQFGINAYGVSYAPGEIQKYKVLMTYDESKLDTVFKEIFTCTPANSQAMAFIPPSALLYQWSGCFQLSNIATQIKSGAESALQNQPKRIRKSLQKKLGTSEFVDFMNLLDKEAGFYLTDVDTLGMFPYPRFLIFVKLKEALKAQALLLNLLGANKGFSFVAKEDYNGSELSYVPLPLGANMDPGFTIYEDYFLFASSRQLLKKSMDIYKEPVKSVTGDKEFKAFKFDADSKPNTITYLNIKEMSKRFLTIIDWYQRYLSHQIELVVTYKKEAGVKKIELTNEIKTQQEDLILAEKKLADWQANVLEELPSEEAGNKHAMIENMQQQIKNTQEKVISLQDQIKQLDTVVAKNELRRENFKGIMYNALHIATPVLKGLQSLNGWAIKFSSKTNVVIAEFMLN